MKNWIRIIATFIMTISIIAIAVSCGGGASDIDGRNNDASNDSSFNNEPVDLVLKDYSYKVSNGYVEYAIAIENPNERFMARFAHVIVTGKRSDGSIVFNSDWTIGDLLPGSITYWASTAGDGDVTEEDTIEFHLSVDSDYWEQVESTSNILYTFDNISVKNDTYGGLKVTGEITLNNPSAYTGRSDVTKPMIVCILKDSDGKIVGGFDGYLSSELKEGTPTAFEIWTYQSIEGYDIVEMYANPWG